MPDWLQPFTEGLRDENSEDEVSLAETPPALDDVGGASEQVSEPEVLLSTLSGDPRKNQKTTGVQADKPTSPKTQLDHACQTMQSCQVCVCNTR